MGMRPVPPQRFACSGVFLWPMHEQNIKWTDGVSSFPMLLPRSCLVFNPNASNSLWERTLPVHHLSKASKCFPELATHAEYILPRPPVLRFHGDLQRMTN